jgi:two-component system chemotaxis response regulator CheY
LPTTTTTLSLLNPSVMSQPQQSVNMDMRILIVDDYATMLRIIKNLLGQLGFRNVDEAKSGKEALEAFNKHKYDMVISDWNMEPMSGIDLLKEVRKINQTVPFIMVTAESKPANVMTAKEAGVSNYIVKPFNAATLKGKLVTVLGQF